MIRSAKTSFRRMHASAPTSAMSGSAVDLDALQRTVDGLRSQPESVQRERAELQGMKAAVEGNLDQFKQRVKLNVGGSKFETTLLTKERVAFEIGVHLVVHVDASLRLRPGYAASEEMVRSTFLGALQADAKSRSESSKEAHQVNTMRTQHRIHPNNAIPKACSL